MNRNPEIIKETIVYLIVACVVAIIALFIDSVAAGFVLLTGIIYVVLHYFFARKRYRNIKELSDSLNKILLGQGNMLMNNCTEGELSILYSEIYKMTINLKEKTALLSEEKEGLTKAIEDIFHQLRTPLTTMNLTVSLLSEEEISYEKRIQLTHDLKRQLERIGWLIESLLKMSKIDAGVAFFDKSTVKVSELIEQAVAPFLIQFDLKDISFITDIHDESYSGDLLWSTEAFSNLIKNAIEHTPEGGKICVTATETPLFTEIRVSDNGEGFIKEDIPNLFKRFFKGQNASDGSIGIGLSLSRSIIKAQNGTILATNNQEGGAEFKVKFYKSVI